MEKISAVESYIFIIGGMLFKPSALQEIAKAATTIGDFRLARTLASKQDNKDTELMTLALILETWARSKDPRLADKIWEK